MVKNLSWRQSDTRDAIVQEAVRALQSGQLVAFPTETIYVVAASAFDEAAVKCLPRLSPGLSIAFHSAEEALEWVPALGTLGFRLARRCWPGPVNLIANNDGGRLPQSLREALGGEIELTVPDHPAILNVMSRLGGPLVIAPIQLVDDTSAHRPDDAQASLGERASIFIDDGPCPHGQSPRAIRVKGSEWELVRESAVSASTLRHFGCKSVVFVCTGNTCRSPMAEALCKKLLADRLGCSVDQLPERGFVVRSAGLSAMMGGSAAFEAMETVRTLGGSLQEHRSQLLSRELAREADLLLAMTHGHLRIIEDRFGHLGVSGKLLNPTGEDIVDPIGNELAVYRTCAEQILKSLEAVLPEVLSS